MRAVADAADCHSGSTLRDRKVLSRTFLDTGRHSDFSFTDAWRDANACGG